MDMTRLRFLLRDGAVSLTIRPALLEEAYADLYTVAAASDLRADFRENLKEFAAQWGVELHMRGCRPIRRWKTKRRPDQLGR